ncbi:unnamed protein product, partial [Commensalibacter communis]|uniref:hypothetical protein n=1 Tax=Commensalibacter communis TaxID=2972786 RepID=UPI0022FF57A9
GGETYNTIANNANRIFGYDWGANADNVRWAQGLLAGGESMQGVLNSFAYGGETYGLIAAMNASILGYAVSDATIRQQQAQLANGASFNDLRNKLLNR